MAARTSPTKMKRIATFVRKVKCSHTKELAKTMAVESIDATAANLVQCVLNVAKIRTAGA